MKAALLYEGVFLWNRNCLFFSSATLLCTAQSIGTSTEILWHKYLFGVKRKVFYHNIYLLSLSTVTLMTFQLDVEGTATPLSTWWLALPGGSSQKSASRCCGQEETENPPSMAWSSTIRSKFTPNLNRHWKPKVSGRENSSIIKVEIYVWYWKRMLVMQKTKNWKTQPQVNFIISDYISIYMKLKLTN